jgi:REP-associated tyrosine transposase
LTKEVEFVKTFKNKYYSNSPRLQVWDYSTPWWYFITTNTKDQKKLFGNITDGRMFLNSIGIYAKTAWSEIPKHYHSVELDEFIIMPNHIHGIIIISEKNVVLENSSNFDVVDEGHAPHLQHHEKNNYQTLSNVVGNFKSAVTKYSNENEFKEFKWQRSFYDRIIRNEEELYNIRRYILDLLQNKDYLKFQ